MVVKQIKLKDKTLIIKKCADEECPLFVPCTDTGYNDTPDCCGLGTPFEMVGFYKDYKSDDSIPKDCPLEDYDDTKTDLGFI